MTKTSVIPDSLSASIPISWHAATQESKDQIPDWDFIKISPDLVPTLTLDSGRCGQLHQAIKILSR